MRLSNMVVRSFWVEMIFSGKLQTWFFTSHGWWSSNMVTPKKIESDRNTMEPIWDRASIYLFEGLLSCEQRKRVDSRHSCRRILQWGWFKIHPFFVGHCRWFGWSIYCLPPRWKAIRIQTYGCIWKWSSPGSIIAQSSLSFKVLLNQCLNPI